MKRIRFSLLAVGGILISSCAYSVHAQQGGWSASVSGPSFQYRGMQASSPALLPAASLQVSADNVVTVIYWRYQLASAAPIDLTVKLCALNRCVNLDSASGQTSGLQGIPANSEFRMMFYVPGTGRISASVDVVSSEISVNYR
ncbi:MULTISPECIES: flagellar protein FlhE [Dickeya]|uniref:flagellar protein FlhE n=1 Tax=Dickeya TaxID=204037 RepID=UPI0008FBD3F9|nr:MULTISPECIES: flagellar protein FlhE [Dickeya]